MLWAWVLDDEVLISHDPVALGLGSREAWFQEANVLDLELLALHELYGHRSLWPVTGIKHIKIFDIQTFLFVLLCVRTSELVFESYCFYYQSQGRSYVSISIYRDKGDHLLTKLSLYHQFLVVFCTVKTTGCSTFCSTHFWICTVHASTHIQYDT